MDFNTAVGLAYQIQRNWNIWSDLDRGDAIVLLRNQGESHRTLAKIAGCSEGTIRNMEIVGRLPWNWKQLYNRGLSTRKIVAAWRAQHAKDAEDEAA